MHAFRISLNGAQFFDNASFGYYADLDDLAHSPTSGPSGGGTLVVVGSSGHALGGGSDYRCRFDGAGTVGANYSGGAYFGGQHAPPLTTAAGVQWLGGAAHATAWAQEELVRHDVVSCTSPAAALVPGARPFAISLNGQQFSAVGGGFFFLGEQVAPPTRPRHPSPDRRVQPLT